MVIDRRMNTLVVIKKLNILENTLLRLFPCFVAVQIDQFLLQHTMERLDAGMVIAVSLPAHAPDHFISIPLHMPLNVMQKKAGVHRNRIHALRYSHASLLISMGENSLIIKERLGHEDIETTLGTDGHLYPNSNFQCS